MGLFNKIKKAANAAYNAFNDKDTEWQREVDVGSYSYGFGRRLSYSNEKSLMAPVINQIAVDAASIDIRHIIVDECGMYDDIIYDDLNYCLSVQSNKDQTAKEFMTDVYTSILDEGVIALVVVDATNNPNYTDSFNIKSLRVGKILNWYPDYVRVSAYNDQKGIQEEIVVPKRTTPIIQNPFWSVMNAPNSTLRRLIRKLNLLDAIDEQSGSGKMDLIFQLPYTIKTESKRKEAEQRRKDIENQLMNSRYGIAYADATERITQLNRPAENNLLSQVEYLTRMFHSQLGVSEKVFNGEAGDIEMTNYYARTIEPLVSAVVDKMEICFLSKTARTQGNAIAYFRDPFKLMPISSMADAADKFTRNEILTSNEIRSIMGYRPVDDPDANKLKNKNISGGFGTSPVIENPEDLNFEDEYEE